MSIDRVEYSRVECQGREGVQLTFFMGPEHTDTFEFYDEVDINHFIGMMVDGATPEDLMVAIRERMNMTVH